MIQQDVLENSRIDPMIVASGMQQEHLKYRTNTDDILSQLYKHISGIEWDSRKQCWVRITYKEPLADPEFITQIMTVLWTITNRNTIYANVSEEECHELTCRICCEIIDLIVLTSDEYHIKEENFGILSSIIENLVFLTLSRAKNDGERRHEDNMFKTVENSTSTIQEQKKKNWIFGGN